jgi:hypothetical protein
MSACVASLLELPIEAVPTFLSEPGDPDRFEWARRLDRFLEPMDLYALHFMADPERAALPGVLHIKTGISPRGRPHAVIGFGHHLVWDPHPSRAGLVECDGFCLIVSRWGYSPGSAERARGSFGGAATAANGRAERRAIATTLTGVDPERMAAFAALAASATPSAWSAERDMQAFLESAEHVLHDVAAWRNSLGPRDLAILQVGMHASHMEEAAAAGDELRAQAHLYALVDLIGQMGDH